MPASTHAVLALDCTLPGLSVGFQVADKTYNFTDSTPRATDALHPALAELCTRAAIQLNDIEKIAVTTGPGSFTGIRLGLAVAQALKLTNPSLEIIGLPTLPLLARQFAVENSAQTQPFSVLLDAAGGMVYRQDFNPDATPAALAVVESLATLALSQPVYLPTSLILAFAPPAGSAFFTTLQPSMLLAAVTEKALHGPAQPTYLKPLTYRKVGE